MIRAFARAAALGFGLTLLATAAQADGAISYSLSASDPTLFGNGVQVLTGNHHYKILNFQPSATGNYVFADEYATTATAPIDGWICFLTTTPFNPATTNPLNDPAACSPHIDDNGSVTLTAGVNYTIFASSYSNDATGGPAVYNYTGPGVLVAPAPVPTLTEWAMILLTGLLAAAGATLLHRRRQTVI
ncbi:IPTL-CTERM sorting domain-containing protein [Brevundimonas staleyi]|uniref:IPTL-CTERM sorting domain-containing protein n=1 Tax=Brevundimonas staleyi TaxID=74326 RepID=A0ABW0FQB1_9CAUL